MPAGRDDVSRTRWVWGMEPQREQLTKRAQEISVRRGEEEQKKMGRVNVMVSAKRPRKRSRRERVARDC